jgi:hydroxyethylthiazole kinase-like sugar kinase family protein
MPSVEIARKEGEASDFVDAVIEEDGRVQMIRNSFGPGDYETEVTAAVAAEDKDRLLLALLERVLGGRHAAEKTYAELLEQPDTRDNTVLTLLKKVLDGNIGAVEAFRDFAQSNGIPIAWFRWP